MHVADVQEPELEFDAMRCDLARCSSSTDRSAEPFQVKTKDDASVIESKLVPVFGIDLCISFPRASP